MSTLVSTKYVSQPHTPLLACSYRRELQEWDEVTEQKRLGVEDAKKTFESERDVDFSQLHCDDVETLKSYLTPEQTEILEQSLPIKPVMVEAKLDAIVREGTYRGGAGCYVVLSSQYW